MKIIIGNWKMNKNSEEAKTYIKQFKSLIKNIDNVEVVIAPPFVLLPILKNEFHKTKVKVAAQNLFYETDGAYTGEISTKMIKDFADYVIIGHSERRKYFNETDETVNKKIKKALNAGLKVIFCLGETLLQRNLLMTKCIVKKQLMCGLKDIKDIENIIIAYEPVWAIGTGRNATAEQAEAVHKYIKKLLEKKVSRPTRIIYGGSVTPENATDILKMPDVDGCLPGGASLDPLKFAKIIEIANEIKVL
jgi:triosephosphate isomerase (TIM)